MYAKDQLSRDERRNIYGEAHRSDARLGQEMRITARIDQTRMPCAASFARSGPACHCLLVATMRDLNTDRKSRAQQEIVEAAIILTERHGVDGWSMRMLADQLGKSAGAAYRHLDGKETLLDLVATEILTRVELPDPAASWEQRLSDLAWGTWSQLSRQRWVARYLLSSPKPAQVAHGVFGAALSQIFFDAGFDESSVALPIGLYAAFMFGSLCGFEAEVPAGAQAPASGNGTNGSRRGRRRRSYTADQHFSYGLGVFVEAIRARGTEIAAAMEGSPATVTSAIANPRPRR
jgi:AcrR family transcriptional regulator